MTALSTFVVALVLALAIPVSQLRTVTVTQTCCCPDPSHCHCPDHTATKSNHDTMRACHKSTDTIVGPTLPELVVPAIELAAAPTVPVTLAVHEIHAPHAAPTPVRPAAPS